MDDPISTLKNNVLQYRFNPAAIVRSGLKVLTAINNGQAIAVDPTNPYIQAIEMAAVETSAFMSELEAESRRRYPIMAQTQEDLYLHMSNKDYINRFSTPAKATFYFRFFKEQLLSAMVLDPDTGYMKLTIPRNSYVTILGTVFSLQYPIDIVQLTHGGLQVTYNTTTPSPLQTLETNQIEYEPLTSVEGDWIEFPVVMTQFSVLQKTGNISLATDLTIKQSFEDQFYYARVYSQNPDSTWTEIVTTHADGIYDITQPTAVLRVVDKQLIVKIPQIYINSGQLASKIRVDLYQSKGAISMPLGEYNTNMFSVTWKTYDSNELKNPYSAPLPNLSMRCYSPEIVVGGQDELPFEMLRKNVILNSTGPMDSWITPAQIENALVNQGYDVVKDVDNVTNRVFLATRPMPTPTLVSGATAASSGNTLLTAAAASIETLSVSTESLSHLATVVNNGLSITITPDTLYQIVDGITQPVPQSEVDRLLALPSDKRALEVTQGSYLYTPFHYVLDANNNAFEIRPYYLDNPIADTKVFVAQNDTTLMQVGTNTYGLVRTKTGYLLQIVTSSDASFKDLLDNQVFVQLAFVPVGERDRAYINGVLVGKTAAGERIYNFDLSTTYNINSNDEMEFTKFTMYNVEPRIVESPLDQKFDIIYSTSAVMSSFWRSSVVDTILGRHLLPQQISGINHEQVRLEFGSALSRLWTRTRTVVGSTPYKTWEVDVPALYEEDVYLRDSNGSAVTIVNGEPTMTILHHAGDPMLDPKTGDPMYRHRRGDIFYDANGNPVATNPRGLIRQMELLLIEGVYWFATDQTTSNYRTALTRTLVSWLTNDLNLFTGNLLDQTRIYFYPKTTSGVVPVYVGDNVRKSILAGQAFNVTLSVPKLVYDNSNLRERLEISTISVISTMLKEKTVSVSQMIESLRQAYGTDVIDVQLSGLGGDANYSVVTMADDTDRLSIRKRLIALADNTLVAEEDVTIAFVLHDV